MATPFKQIKFVNIISLFLFNSANLDDVVGDSYIFTKSQIDTLKETARKGKAPLSERIISTNDVISYLSM